ncbi:MAG: hypothetical protein E4H26_12275 [Flavobacteriales bacterium]|nr:MAG: hypothetical protein E4H26_12275 [Flavobacteriales bacterium]
MGISVFTKEIRPSRSIAHFMDFYYSLHMKHLASDLLDQGLSPRQINDAVLRAIRVGKSSGLDVRQHFMPVFSSMDREIIRDCKLSQLGYGLVLMNADARSTAVGRWQISVLQRFYKVN